MSEDRVDGFSADELSHEIEFAVKQIPAHMDTTEMKLGFVVGYLGAQGWKQDINDAILAIIGAEAEKTT